MFGGGHHATDEHGKVIPEPPKTVGPDTSNFPISPVTDEKDRLHDHPSAFSGGATLVRKFGSMLVGGGDSSRRHHVPAKRATILGGVIPTTRTTNGATDEEKIAPKTADKEKKDETTAPNLRPSDHPQPQAPPPLTTTIHTTPPSPTSSPVSSPSTPRKSMMPPFATAHRRAATILDPQGRTIRHERRNSTSAALMGNTASSSLPSGGTVGRSRRPSTGYSTSGRPLAERLFGPKTSEPLSAPVGGTESEQKEEDGESGAQSAGEVTDRDEDDRNTVKPVFLKGLFRYAFFSLILKLELIIRLVI